MFKKLQHDFVSQVEDILAEKKMSKSQIAYKPSEIAYFVKNGIKIEDINCGAQHMIAMDSHRTLFSWGSNKLGQCGIGKVKPDFVEIPKRIKMGKNVKISEWRVGAYHSFVKSTQNQWFAFGSNAFRQCILKGEEFDERVPMPTLIDPSVLPKKCKIEAMDIVCGRETTLILF